MFERTLLVNITPCFGQLGQRNAFFLFVVLDIIPNIFYCFYFLILSIIEIYTACKLGLIFTEERYKKAISIRIFFYLFSILFAVFIFYYKNRNIPGFFTSIENYLILFVELVFILWNIYMSFSFLSSLKNTHVMEGFLGDESDDFEHYLPENNR